MALAVSLGEGGVDSSAIRLWRVYLNDDAGKPLSVPREAGAGTVGAQLMVNYNFGERFPFRILHGCPAGDTIGDLELAAGARAAARDYAGHAAAALAQLLLEWARLHPHGSWAVLRGVGPTRFLAGDTVRDGRGVALAQDAVDLADALRLERFAVVGHDWGARAAYTLAALFPERVTWIVGIALAYQPRGAFILPPFSQARRFWYQWFMMLDAAAEAVRADPTDFARSQWDTWSPPGWFDQADFATTARSFANPDWTSVTLNAYRGRWQREPSDGHFLPREAPNAVADRVIEHLSDG